MSFKTLIKNKQNRMLSKTWRTALVAREIERNNYHVTGDLQKARDFANEAVSYQPSPVTDIKPFEPIVIFG